MAGAEVAVRAGVWAVRERVWAAVRAELDDDVCVRGPRRDRIDGTCTCACTCIRYYCMYCPAMNASPSPRGRGAPASQPETQNLMPTRNSCIPVLPARGPGRTVGTPGWTTQPSHRHTSRFGAVADRETLRGGGPLTHSHSHTPLQPHPHCNRHTATLPASGP